MNAISDDTLRDILRTTRVIAVVGVSPNPVRPSFYVARYLLLYSFRVLPDHPGHAWEEILGQRVHADIASIPKDARVDMVDIFRRSDAVPEIVEEALRELPDLRTIWMQIGVQHPDAAARAEAAGMRVVQNRCPKIEYQRLFGELRMGGFATGVISAKL